MLKESSLQEDAAQFVFDLDSQKGVMNLLASVRASEITSDQKNELRDLVFHYANGGKDESVRLTLEKKISTYGVVLVPALEVVKNAPARELSFGTSRPAPSFAPSATSIAAVSAIDEATAEPVSVASATPSVPAQEPVAPVVVSTPTPTPTPVVETIPEPAPQVVAPSSEQPAPTIVPESSITPVIEPAPVAITQAPETVPIMTAPPAPVAETAVSFDSAQNLQRIREIKSIVNDKVGNPVNLVDIDNKVGREYMSSLLEAMKGLNNGSSSISAMKRLETSFVEVQKTIENHKKNPVSEADDSPVPAAKVPEPVASVPVPLEPAPKQAVKSEPVIKVEVPVVTQEPEIEPPVLKSPPPVPEPKEEVRPTIKEVLEGKEEESESSLFKISQSNFPDTPEVEVPVVPEKEVSVPVVVEKSDAEKVPQSDEGAESSWGPATDTLTPDKEFDREIKVASLAETEDKISTLDNLPTAESLETSSVEGDPLFTKEVDNGLNALLMEWSLFKKSGLFGTGPKGMEHPLFKKISELQIPLLLAGRFEGATQEIKQSITDYMNGWRYEQGIIYEQGENFGHYLRRVIKHILDLQKK